MSVIWGERAPGSGTMVADGLRDEGLLVIDNGEFDWVKVPEEADHEDAGKRLRVAKFKPIRCVCGTKHISRITILEKSTFAIIECVITSKFYGVSRDKND